MELRTSRGWALWLVLLSSVGCDTFADASNQGVPVDDSGAAAGAPVMLTPQPTIAIGGTLTLPNPTPTPRNDLGAECDPSRSVGADGPALIVTDPEVLAEFPLERVLQRIAVSAQVQLTPEQLLQRLFDTENTVAGGVFTDVQHCDAPDNFAFGHAPAVDCPRTEGQLATSTNLFTPDAADFFAPVALVNRFDLTPSDRSTCGEYRIVYAKHSGLSDPQDRVFLIFEAALFNPSASLSGCRPVVELWQGLSGADVATQKARLSALYFSGVGGLEPVITAGHLSAGGISCQYTGRCGQIRVGQGMQAPFQFRQFRLVTSSGLDQQSRLAVVPTEDSQSLRPQLFQFPSTDASAAGFQLELQEAVQDLASPDLARMRAIMGPAYDAGESAVSGAARPNFAERLTASDPSQAASFAAGLSQRLAESNAACPSDDPLTPDSIVQRATALTCAGCHAPEQVLAEGRKLGCGGIWPLSLGETHIDERGELSPALTDLFLPHRARVLSTFLQACDAQQVEANLQPVPAVLRGECFPAGTPIALADGSSKPIEQVQPADWVLSFDPISRAPVPARVTARIVRPDAERFVRINQALLATDNHPFFTDSGWVRAVDLQLGSQLLALDRTRNADEGTGLAVAPESVARLTLEAGSGSTYNLHVAGHHGYFAGGLLVNDQP
jgi:hypothetical protein